ncbi:MAG: radical SAM protein [Pseudomonadota bacterium]
MTALRRDLRFAEALLTGKGPLYVQFAVTTRCNLACPMCQATAARARERELTLAEVEALARTLARLRVAIAVLTGGEPLLREDLEQVVRLFRTHGLDPRLQTNGLLATPARVRRLVNAGLREATVSLHGLDAATHERVTGRPGSWAGAMAGLAAFGQSLLPLGGINGVNITVTRHNLGQVPALVRFATAAGFWASLIPLHAAAGDPDTFVVRSDGGGAALRPEDHPLLERVWAEVVALKRAGHRVYNSHRFLEESLDYQRSGTVRWRCASPDLYFSVSPEGRFLPCVDLPGGPSMLAPDFLATFRSRAFREEVRRRVAACEGCMYACYPELVWATNDPRTVLERVAFARQVARGPREGLDEGALRALAASLLAEDRR